MYSCLHVLGVLHSRKIVCSRAVLQQRHNHICDFTVTFLNHGQTVSTTCAMGGDT